MKFELVVRPKAEEDIAQSAIWYEGKVRGMGISFIEALDSALTVIQANPTTYQKRYKEVRMAKLKRFPFCVHYTIESPKVIIHAVLHTRRNPKTWLSR